MRFLENSVFNKWPPKQKVLEIEGQQTDPGFQNVLYQGFVGRSKVRIVSHYGTRQKRKDVIKTMA